ncbi:MAG: hypothetical protein J6Q19_04795 [Bacteroidaceae bacterium]|nr:hypothetical protein [Bacteroidaceae bacterium]
MERYSANLRVETITANTRLNDNKYGAWLAMNIGSAPVSVYGIELQPGEGLSSESIVHLHLGDIWAEPIVITVQPGGAVRLLRSLATEIKSGRISSNPGTIPSIR